MAAVEFARQIVHLGLSRDRASVGAAILGFVSTMSDTWLPACVNEKKLGRKCAGATAAEGAEDCSSACRMAQVHWGRYCAWKVRSTRRKGSFDKCIAMPSSPSDSRLNCWRPALGAACEGERGLVNRVSLSAWDARAGVVGGSFDASTFAAIFELVAVAAGGIVLTVVLLASEK
jgi:hypothetical protein